MATYVEERTLDLRKRRGRAGGIKPVVLRQGEKGAKISIEITDDDAAFDMTGHSARFCAVNASGRLVRNTATITSHNPAKVLYTIGSNLTEECGSVMVAYVELTSSGVSMTTDTIPIIVLPDADITDEQAEEYKSTVDEMIDAAQEAAVAAALSAFESTYEEAEASRDARYSDAETARDDAYAAAEAARNLDTQSAPFTVVDGRLCITYYDGTI